MIELTYDYIKKHAANNDAVFKRGVRLYENGAFSCVDYDAEKGHFIYEIDGNYGDYLTVVKYNKKKWETDCDCPYPENGCKHIVAVLFDIRDRLKNRQRSVDIKPEYEAEENDSLIDDCLTLEEMKNQALEDRKKRAKNENMQLIKGDMFKGEHIVKNEKGAEYVVTLHKPDQNGGHCSCPDFVTNRLGTCKHILFACRILQKDKSIKKRVAKERFPFVDIYWDSVINSPRLFNERPDKELTDIASMLDAAFDKNGRFIPEDLSELVPLLSGLYGNKKVRIQENVLSNLDHHLENLRLRKMSATSFSSMDQLKTKLYPYQEEGVKFCLFKKAALIGDEMGLGKTLQAVALSILKRDAFGFEKVLVITLASLKEQWKREIEKFTNEKAHVIAGNAKQRRDSYENTHHFFKITNYEAVLRDVDIISRFNPDLVILDEAQRIKNFSTKTADAVKRIPRKHALVLTGTPLENKLEDVYSIIQFLDMRMLSPLWQFAADHFMISRAKKGKILGYRNLEQLHEKLQSIVIRRKKDAVLSDLPETLENNYFIELSNKQTKIHGAYLQNLLPLLNKKYLTPVDLRRIQEILLKMRMACDSTYLIDRQTNISPKLKELDFIIDELVVQNNRKVVIFSEWTTMTFLIAKSLSRTGIKFVELSGKIPVAKRQALIDEFSSNPECKVFLSTDAGGTGLNLQAADTVINFEIPWNPAKLNQRVGRVNRIGQKSKCVNVVNLISKNSIEEKILAGIQLKTELFEGVFDGTTDEVRFSREKRMEKLNQLREMLADTSLTESMEASVPDEIPEDTPHYLNPDVMTREERRLNYSDEEIFEEETDAVSDGGVSPDTEKTDASLQITDAGDKGTKNRSALHDQPPEKIEAVLNSGVQFISGLLEMATGKALKPTEDNNKMIHIDRESGEVTMKFKLPVF